MAASAVTALLLASRGGHWWSHSSQHPEQRQQGSTTHWLGHMTDIVDLQFEVECGSVSSVNMLRCRTKACQRDISATGRRNVLLARYDCSTGYKVRHGRLPLTSLQRAFKQKPKDSKAPYTDAETRAGHVPCFSSGVLVHNHSE